jgi:hypothetical protein
MLDTFDKDLKFRLVSFLMRTMSGDSALNYQDKHLDENVMKWM